ncbi:murein transglycosylase [Candidatus Magnetomorum sp. HK-1]|nr:murein transglycosylase [Candidatus Magnetomorum sp. HK-1]
MKTWLCIIILFVFHSNVFAEPLKSIPLLEIKGVNWTSEEITFIKSLNKKGSITIATKISPAVYLPQNDGSITGFHYCVFKEFADLVKIEIIVKLVSWNDYFYKKGKDLEKVKKDPAYSYIPTLIENVDLYIDGITVLPWREKMIDIIKLVPSRQMLVCRKDNLPLKLHDMNNKSCVMVKNTSMEYNIENIKKKNDIFFTYIYTEKFYTMDKMVSEGKADFTVYDSDRAYVALKNYNNLTIAFPISKHEIMGWAINKKNSIMKNVIEKFIKFAQDTAILDKYWKAEYGVTFIEYLKVLKLR